MTTRIKENQLKGVIVLVVITLLMMQVFITQAQSFKGSDGVYRGIFASFGTRPVSVSSDIEKIDQTNLMETGGQIGVIIGNSVLRSKIGLIGYYSSAGNTAGTTDLHASNATAHFYPLSLFTSQKPLVEPYLTGGIAYDRFKFFGYYLNQEPGTMNYSQTEAPFLGKITQVNATVGVGIEVRLRDDSNFIHLFSEARWGQNLSSKASDAAFANTALKDQMHISIGISFGAR